MTNIYRFMSFPFIQKVSFVDSMFYKSLQCKKFSSSSLLNANLSDETVSPSSGLTPRRAILYVPGSEQNKLTKLEGLEVDCAVMDCEDGVAINRKDVARDNICRALDNLMTPGVTDLAVRVNSMDSGLVVDDLRTIFKAHNLPETLMLPKVNSEDDLNSFSDILTDIVKKKQLTKYKAKLVIFVESAIGLLNLSAILRQGVKLSSTSPLQLEALVFGSDDFCADIGATRTEHGGELMYARQKVVATAKAFGLQAIDLVHINFRDLKSLEKQSVEGATMGFTGKQVIHPNQVPVVQQAFSPSEEKIEWAQELVKAFKEHESCGKGAMTFRGSMIDMPLVLQAKNILNLVNLRNKDSDR